MERFGDAPEGLSEVLIGGREIGEVLVDDPRVPVVSATGSTAMGRAGRPAARRALRPRHPRARRQQRRDRLRRRPTSTWRCAPSPSRPWARPASAARRCAACSSTRASTTASSPRLRRVYGSVRDRRSARGRHAGRPADRPRAPSKACERALEEARAAGGTVHGGERVVAGTAGPTPSTCSPALVEMPAQTGPGDARDLRADPLRHALPRRSTRRSRLHNARRRRACPPRSSPSTCARPRPSSRSRAPTAASPTSTSARRAPRSAAPSAARRRPAAAARPAPTPGRPTCAAPPTRSTTARTLPLAQGVKFDIDA